MFYRSKISIDLFFALDVFSHRYIKSLELLQNSETKVRTDSDNQNDKDSDNCVRASDDSNDKKED